MTPQRIIVGLWLAAIAIIVVSQQSQDAGAWPPAYRVGGAAITYTALLGLAAVPGAGSLAVVFAIAWTLGLGWRARTGGAAPVGFAPPHATSAQRAPSTSTPAKAASHG